MKEGKDISHFVGAHDLTMRDHLEVQKIVQRHIDNAVSKTINMAHDYPIEEMSELWLEYLPYLKGTTFYREGTRGYVNDKGGVEAPPLTPISLEEAQAKYRETSKEDAAKVIDCPKGVCEI
jgi:ribonucleoside-diphosphate reductase alpha chain